MTELELTALRSKKLFVLDMDGTFYLGDRILDGSLKFIEKLRETGRSFLFFTNNSSKTSDFYRQKLARMGCEVGLQDIITSGDVTIDILKREYPGKSVYLLGTPLLTESFERAGIRLVKKAPDLVVLGFDMTLDYQKLCDACEFIRGGAGFIATHPDFNCPTETGFIPDCGAMAAFITASTGLKPRVLGKPNPETVDAVVSLTGFAKNELVFVGDRLYTDIAIGVQNGVTSLLVLTGETGPEELAMSEIKPDYVFASLGELADQL